MMFQFLDSGSTLAELELLVGVHSSKQMALYRDICRKPGCGYENISGLSKTRLTGLTVHTPAPSAADH